MKKVVSIKKSKIKKSTGCIVQVNNRKQKMSAQHRGEQKDRFRIFFESSLLPMAMASPQKDWIEVNDRLCEMLGYSREELQAANWMQLSHPEDREIDQCQLNRVLDGEIDGYSLEKRMVRKDAGVVETIQSVHIVRSPGGGLDYYIFQLQDITERKQKEKQLSLLVEEETIMADIVRIITSAPAIDDVYASFAEATRRLIPFHRIAVNLIDFQKKMVYSAYADGVSYEGRKTGQWFDLKGTFACELAQTRKSILLFAEKEEDLSRRYPMALPFWRMGIRSFLMTPLVSGNQPFGSLSIMSCRNRAYGNRELRLAEKVAFQISGAIVNARLLVEQKMTEEELKRLQSYLANIINSMPSVLVGVDKHGCVTQWNMAAEKMTGMSASAAQGRPLDLVLPVFQEEFQKVGAAIRNRKVQTRSKVAKKFSGETRYHDLTVYPLVTNCVEGVVIRLDDITERVRIEEMIIQSEKMMSVGSLAAGMAHEINNPLGVILQASQNLLRRVSSDLEGNARAAEASGTTLEAVRRYFKMREIPLFLEDIRTSGQRAAEIVENMLSFSRKPAAEKSATQLVELMDKTLVLAAGDYDLKKKYDFRRIDIVREYETGLPAVNCHAGKLQQVFLNILKNGAEAMSSSSSPERQGRFILRVLQKGPAIQVEIEDNGPGMDDKTRRRVFEPFFTTKAPGEGTGLGLSVSYFIITENHGGTIEVASQQGTGTRFIIRLPVKGKRRGKSR